MAGGMRGVNPHQMQRAMRSMGIKQSKVEDVVEVIIRTKTQDIVLSPAEVTCIEMKGTKQYEVAGVENIMAAGSATGAASAGPAYPEEDIELVMSQTNCDRDKALAALEECGGEPAEAIIKIMSE